MKRMPSTAIVLFLFSLTMITGSCTTDPRDKMDRMHHERKYELERVGPAQVVQLYSDGFDQLSRREKIFSYYMYLAALAARDISIDQHHRNGLEVRELLEEIYRHSSSVEPRIREKIVQYTKLFWINNGFYDNLTSQKFIPGCSFEEFKQAVHAAELAGAKFMVSGETLDWKLERVRPVIFDPKVDPVLTDKTPGEDWIKGSAVNFHGPGLTYDDVEKWASAGNEKNPLNSTIVKEHGKIVEKVWRAGSVNAGAGGKGISPGLYAEQLNAAISYLEQAIPYAASNHQAETLRLLVRYYRTGDLEDFRKFNIHWVKDSSNVDFIHGFIEVYLDPRGAKAEFESSLYYTDPAQTKLMQNLARYAQYFEEKAPWKDEYKKKIDRSPIANVINIIVGTGGTGPIMPIGINLPNEQSIREQYGSKSVLLNNVQDAYDKSTGKELLKEVAWDEQEVQNQEQYGTVANNLHTAMHEVIGHGSGKASQKLKGRDPSDFLPGYYSTLEEARADLVALWNAWDPKLVDIGIAKDEAEARKIGETMFQQQIRVALTQLRRIGTNEQLEEDHMKNRQLNAYYIIKHSDAVKVEQRNGKTYYHVVDFDAARKAAGELLAEIMRIKAEGDLAAAKALVDTYGLKIDVKLRDEIQDRVKYLKLPSYTGFVMPKLEPVSDPTAKIVDIKVSYPLDIATQMLEYSAFTKALYPSAPSGVSRIN